MDPSSPEVVAGRAVAVYALERFIHARSAIFCWGAAAIAALLWVGTFASGGLGAVVVGLFALVATTVAGTLFVTRNVVVRAVRRVGGGRDYARLRPIVARRMAQVEHARTIIPLDPPSALRLAWMVRRPKVLRAHVREVAATVAHTIPEVVDDVRRELGGQPIRTP